ncbi:MAG: carbon storage regulator [Planctomycetaceae bacterium]|nr:MAG: carbon storage regulator [Planctomycetaceae bacterium]
MLVLSRKVGEQICLPQLDIVLTVLEVRGGRVRLGITAPERISVVRKELRDGAPQNTERAVDSKNDSSGPQKEGPTMDDSTLSR